MTGFHALIPEMQEWSRGRGVDVHTWIACTGHFRLAVGHSTLFWPTFVEFEDYVPREGFPIENLRGFAAQPKRNPTGAESVMNHLPLDRIQLLGCEDIRRERLCYLGHTLQQVRRAKLAWQFPSCRFEVEFIGSPDLPSEAHQLTPYQTGGNEV